MCVARYGVNGDGDLDAAVANFGTGDMSVLLNVPHSTAPRTGREE